MKKIFTHAGEGKRKIGCRFLPIWGKTGRRFGAAAALVVAVLGVLGGLGGLGGLLNDDPTKLRWGAV